MSNKLQIQDDEIGRRLQESEASGELKQAKGYGKPLDLGDGYFETPEELRMGYKILKDSGFTPPEIELKKNIAQIREQLDRIGPGEQRETLLRKLHDMEIGLALAMDRLRGGRP